MHIKKYGLDHLHMPNRGRKSKWLPDGEKEIIFYIADFYADYFNTLKGFFASLVNSFNQNRFFVVVKQPFFSSSLFSQRDGHVS